MSIIVVVKKAGKVVIAADSLVKFGETKVAPQYRKTDKIISFENSYIGITGASAHLKVFQHLTEEHSDKICFDNEKEIFNTYLKLHPILKESYFMNSNEDGDNSYESSQINALIANPSGIFGMYTWREVYEYERFWALGSGFDCAIGAMYATYELFNEPEQIAEIGVRAACEFDDACGLPLTIHSVILNQDQSDSVKAAKRKKKK